MTAFAQLVPETSQALERAREGDHAAFAELIQRHQSMVFSIAYHFFGDRTVAEEIAQDVFLQLYRSMDTIDGDSHLLFWMRQVTTRRCIDQGRRAKFRRVALEDAGELEAVTPQRDPLLEQKLRRELEELPPMQRLVVSLRYQEDLDPMDIAAIVELPVNTVKSHLHRALGALRRKLETRNGRA